mmetsp:Transcript_51904/g.120748  ORF Transcript_51904/g.120748 Transcript_51904/m.120748 type:complete len:238 (-) Transcript_51904:482-1195(-)
MPNLFHRVGPEHVDHGELVCLVLRVLAAEDEEEDAVLQLRLQCHRADAAVQEGEGGEPRLPSVVHDWVGQLPRDDDALRAEGSQCREQTDEPKDNELGNDERDTALPRASWLAADQGVVNLHQQLAEYQGWVNVHSELQCRKCADQGHIDAIQPVDRCVRNELRLVPNAPVEHEGSNQLERAQQQDDNAPTLQSSNCKGKEDERILSPCVPDIGQHAQVRVLRLLRFVCFLRKARRQ